MVLLTGTLLATGAGAEPRAGIACGLPVVLRAEITDIHESPLNGPEGFAFFREAGAEKVGELPREVGRDPVRRFETDVYASNFQGPVLVRHPGLRAQWEWTADGEPEVSERAYPLVFARGCAPTAAALPRLVLHVLEHDEFPWRNDAVGAFAVDLARCARVVDGERRAGWTEPLHAEGLAFEGDGGARDVVSVIYTVWCYPCPGPADCGEGVVP